MECGIGKKIMTNARRIYWYLFWDLGYDHLNKKVSQNLVVGDKAEVEFYCKVIALKSMNKNLAEVWEEVQNERD